MIYQNRVAEAPIWSYKHCHNEEVAVSTQISAAEIQLGPAGAIKSLIGPSKATEPSIIYVQQHSDWNITSEFQPSDQSLIDSDFIKPF